MDEVPPYDPTHQGYDADIEFLHWMNLGNVDDIRDQYDADIVTLFVPIWSSNVCGIANLRYYDPVADVEKIETGAANYEWTDQAFSVQLIGCGLVDLTYGHEIGHNFSLWHSADFTSSKLPLEDYPDPTGHIYWTAFGQRATVMECIDSQSCDRTGYFSNPNFTVPMYGITPTGKVDHDNGYYANAYQVLIGLISEYANLR